MTIFTIIAPVLLWTAAVAAEDQAPDWNNVPTCAELEAYDPGDDALLAKRREAAFQLCRLPDPVLTVSVADEVLAGRRFNIEVDLNAGELIVAARPTSGTVRTSGAISAELDPVGEGRFASRFRLARIDEAMLTFYLWGSLLEDDADSNVDLLSWRGPNAPDPLSPAEDLMGDIHELVLYSEALGETRRLVVYTPPGYEAGAGPYPAVFRADGGAVYDYGRALEPHILAGNLPPLVLVGAVSGQRGIVEDRSELDTDLRAADYLPGWYDAAPRFEQHMQFFADELTAWAEDAFAVSPDPADRVVSGRSNSGVFALHAGYLRPDRFGAALPHSPGFGTIETADLADGPAARFFFSVGLYEPRFLVSARQSHAALEAAGYETDLTELAAGHTAEITDTVLVDQLQQIFAEP